MSKTFAEQPATADVVEAPETRHATPDELRPLVAAFDLDDRCSRAAEVTAIVRGMRLPFAPEIAAMADMFETVKAGRLLRGRKQVGSLLLDPTGTGKTTAAEALAAVLAARSPDGRSRMVHCRMPASGTAAGLFANALVKLGDKHVNQAREHKLLTQLLDRLAEERIDLLVIDEAQQGTGTSNLGGQIAAAIKMILDAGVAPVAILGTDAAVGVLAKDRELAGRLSAPSSLAPLVWNDDYDREIWIGLLGKLDVRLQKDGACTAAFGFCDPVLAEKLMRAANGTIGQLMAIVRTAAREMARAERTVIAMEDLVFAVDAWAVQFGFVTVNPLSAA